MAVFSISRPSSFPGRVREGAACPAALPQSRRPFWNAPTLWRGFMGVARWTLRGRFRGPARNSESCPARGWVGESGWAVAAAWRGAVPGSNTTAEVRSVPSFRARRLERTQGPVGRLLDRVRSVSHSCRQFPGATSSLNTRALRQKERRGETNCGCAITLQKASRRE